MSAVANPSIETSVLPAARKYPLVPGAVFATLIACAAYGAHSLPGVGKFSPMILAITIGILVRNLVGLPVGTAPGIAFSQRRVLRFAIVLLGLQLTATQVAEVGAGGVALIAGTLVATFLFTTWLGRLLGVDARLTQLIAAGTSICGASAVIATNTVTRGSEEDVAYAVACVTLFGSIAMFAYPMLPGLLSLDPHAYGLWSGASIHEIAQVVAAAFENGRQSGEFGTVAKLTRVMMLAPVVITLGLIASRRAGDRDAAKAPMPWFVLGFVALVALNSVITIPADLKSVATPVTTFLLSVALAAMGLSTDVAELKAKGIRPLLLGLASFLFIATFSLTLVKLTT